MSSVLLALPETSISVFRSFCADLEENFNLYNFPVINLQALDFDIETVLSYDFLVFGSSFAVQVFLDKADILTSLPTLLTTGQAAQDVLQQNGLSVLLAPSSAKNFSGLVTELKQRNLIKDKKFLTITGQYTAADSFAKMIETEGGICDKLTVYAQNMPAEPIWPNLTQFLAQPAQAPKMICVTSPLGVKNLHNMLQNQKFNLSNNHLSFLALADETARTVQTYFQHEVYLPENSSYQAMVNFLKSFYSKVN